MNIKYDVYSYTRAILHVSPPAISLFFYHEPLVPVRISSLVITPQIWRGTADISSVLSLADFMGRLASKPTSPRDSRYMEWWTERCSRRLSRTPISWCFFSTNTIPYTTYFNEPNAEWLGLEPRYRASKALVLPIRRSLNYGCLR